eukprot:281051_1
MSEFCSKTYICDICNKIAVWNGGKQYATLGDGGKEYGVLADHVEHCIYCGNQSLIRLFETQKSKSISLLQKIHFLKLIAIPKQIREQYLIKNKKWFLTLFEDFDLFMHTLEDTIALPIFACMRRKQYKWIAHSPVVLGNIYDLYSVMNIQGGPPKMLLILCAILIMMELKNIAQYQSKLTCEDIYEWTNNANASFTGIICPPFDRFNRTELLMVACNYMKVIKEYMYFTDKSSVQCGNIQCTKKYLNDRFGINKRLGGHISRDVVLKVREMRYKKQFHKKWYICKGCKSTHYCGRKCQKLSWNQQNHKYQCQRIQQLCIT